MGECLLAGHGVGAPMQWVKLGTRTVSGTVSTGLVTLGNTFCDFANCAMVAVHVSGTLKKTSTGSNALYLRTDTETYIEFPYATGVSGETITVDGWNVFSRTGNQWRIGERFLASPDVLYLGCSYRYDAAGSATVTQTVWGLKLKA